MAVFSEPPTFLNLYGADGLGLLVGLRDDTTDLPGRKNAINMAYVELADYVKAYWRNRSFDYTSSSTPALTAGTRAYNVPATSGAVFDSIGVLYYRSSGAVIEVPIVDDLIWLSRSATRSTDAGAPDYARIVQTSSSVQVELNRPVNQTFIDQTAPLTLEYFISVSHLSGDTDTTILPRQLVLRLLPIAAQLYAFSQGDHTLADRLAPLAERAREEALRKDLTRIGRPRQSRPRHNYLGTGRVHVTRDYGVH